MKADQSDTTTHPTDAVKKNSRLPGSRRTRIWAGYGIAIGAYAFLMSVVGSSDIPFETAALGVLLAAVCVFPIAFWAAQSSPGTPMFELICLSYGAQYSLPLFLVPNQITIFSQQIPLAWDETQQSIFLVTLGIGIMILAYYLVRHIRATERLPRIHIEVAPPRITWILLLGLGLQMLSLGLGDIGQTPSNSSIQGELLRILSFQGLVALALIALFVFRHHPADKRWTALLYLSALAMSTLGLASGALENAVLPPVILLVVRWQATRKLPLRWILVAALAFVLLNSVKSEYRVQSLTAETYGSLPARLGLWVTLVDQQFTTITSNDPSTATQLTLQPATNRLDLLHIFTWIHSQTPNQVPYFSGGTYSYFLYGWIPRLLWPDKPDSSLANLTFESNYRLLQRNQLSGSSIGVGHPAEAYANYGASGLLIVMSMQGIFFAILRRLLDVESSLASQAIYVAVMVFFLNGIGSYTSILFTGAVENALVSVLILKFAVSWAGRQAQKRGMELAQITKFGCHGEA